MMKYEQPNETGSAVLAQCLVLVGKKWTGSWIPVFGVPSWLLNLHETE